jgi:hypothetical protein
LGGAIAEAVRQALDQAVQAQAAQLVGDRALGDRFRIAAGQSRKLLAQIAGAEALCKLAEQDDGMQQRVDARVGKAQARGPLAAFRDRAVNSLKGIFRQDEIMTDVLDIEQAAVGRKTDFAQLRQIAWTLADAEIVAVVDGSLGVQGAAVTDSEIRVRFHRRAHLRIALASGQISERRPRQAGISKNFKLLLMQIKMEPIEPGKSYFCKDL